MPWPERFETSRLVLRRPRLDDADAIYREYAADAEVTRWLTWRPHTDVEATREFLRRADVGWTAGNDLTWVLVRRDEGRVVGMIGVRPRLHMCDIGYVLARRCWGQGFMPEAGAAVVAHAFADPAVYRVWATCDVDNHASARVLEKIGMTCEGILRRWILHPHVSAAPRDSYCYARVR